MLIAALSFLRLNPRILLFGGLGLIVTVAFIWWSAHERHVQFVKDQAVLHRVQADLATCRTNTVTLEAAITRQNAAVDALRKDSEARVAQSAKAVSAARVSAQGARHRADVILAARPGVDQCKSAEALIEEAVQ